MQKITRTITESFVSINAYDTDTKSLTTLIVIIPGNFKKLRFKEKAIRNVLAGNLKLVEVLDVQLMETKYTISVDDFMKYATKGEAVEAKDENQEEEV